MKRVLILLVAVGLFISCATSMQQEQGIVKAAREGDFSTVARFLERGVDPNGTSDTGHTALHMAVIHGHTPIVDLLLEHGADLGVRGPEDTSVLSLAVLAQQFDMAEHLVEKGADTSQDELNKTLMLTVNFKLTQSALFALEELGAVPEPDSLILLFALMKEEYELVNPLLALGVSPLVKEGKGRSVLRYAGGNIPVVEELVAAGADINNIPNDGVPPVSSAAMEGNLELVRRYLEWGAEINPVYSEPMENGRTPLPPLVAAITAEDNNREIAELLIREGADVNCLAVDDDGKSVSPLIVSILTKKADLAAFLLEEGADAYLETGWGTPVQLAAGSDSSDIVELFAGFGR